VLLQQHGSKLAQSVRWVVQDGEDVVTFIDAQCDDIRLLPPCGSERVSAVTV
jgi:hypothetical protein